MEILISMKADDMRRTKFKNLQMDMPDTQTNGHFIAELREAEIEKIVLLKRYGEILLNLLMQKHSSRVTIYTILRTKTRLPWNKIFSAVSAFWHNGK